MIRTILVMTLGLTTLAASPVHADACDAEVLPDALGVVLDSTQMLVAKARDMDAYVQACPDHPWVNMLGANTNMVLFRALLQANKGVFNQDAVNQLAQAFARSQRFYDSPPGCVKTGTGSRRLPVSEI
ncbi:hypothetical protein [Orrella marina]|uniref:Uncharacterized protein n=1 Tax=Orrella marina TaxID=2163011 RepID=A0A2R4XL80_9BURK|nr:hypothetical protein [Orrella marina]AWB34534.1 hypothetical protein DBV39_13355 [Orrella marina]